MDEVLKEVYHSITKRKSPALPEVSLPEKETKGQKQLVFLSVTDHRGRAYVTRGAHTSLSSAIEGAILSFFENMTLLTFNLRQSN